MKRSMTGPVVVSLLLHALLILAFVLKWNLDKPKRPGGGGGGPDLLDGALALRGAGDVPRAGPAAGGGSRRLARAAGDGLTGGR